LDDIGLTNFGLPIIIAFVCIFTLYVLSYVYSPLRPLFHIFSRFSSKHPKVTKAVSSIILVVIWFCFIDAYVALYFQGLFLLSVFLAIALVVPSVGLLDLILEEWDFLKVAAIVVIAWFLLYIAYYALSSWVYWWW